MDRFYSDSDRNISSGVAVPIAGFLAGVGLGIAAAYLLDPDGGARRRSLIGDKFTSATYRIPRVAQSKAQDVSNRARGIWARAMRLFSTDIPSDQVVEARVRTNLGRVVSSPQAITVTARDGCITLDGVALALEVPALVKAVMDVPGVKTVDCQLTERNSLDGMESLTAGKYRGQIH